MVCSPPLLPPPVIRSSLIRVSLGSTPSAAALVVKAPSRTQRVLNDAFVLDKAILFVRETESAARHVYLNSLTKEEREAVIDAIIEQHEEMEHERNDLEKQLETKSRLRRELGMQKIMDNYYEKQAEVRRKPSSGFGGCSLTVYRRSCERKSPRGEGAACRRDQGIGDKACHPAKSNLKHSNSDRAVESLEPTRIRSCRRDHAQSLRLGRVAIRAEESSRSQ